MEKQPGRNAVSERASGKLLQAVFKEGETYQSILVRPKILSENTDGGIPRDEPLFVRVQPGLVKPVIDVGQSGTDSMIKQPESGMKVRA